MKSSLTIRNANVVLPGKIEKTDVSANNGVINAIGSEIPEVGEEPSTLVKSPVVG